MGVPRGICTVSRCAVVVVMSMMIPITQATAQDRGGIFAPEDGELRVRCESPALALSLLVDEHSSGAEGFAMGFGILQPHTENFGVHAVSEVSIMLDGVGRFVLGRDTTAARPGTTMHVPAGALHGFINDGDAVLRFAWVVVPGGLEKTIRDTWQTPESCRQPHPTEARQPLAMR